MEKRTVSWTFEDLMDLATGYWRSGVLSAAVELDLFDVLEGKGAGAREAASRTGASERHMAEVLDALTGLDILDKRYEATGPDGKEKEAVYRIKPSAAQFLTRSGAHSILDALRFNTDLYPLWGKVAQCVRDGRPVLPQGAHLGMDPARTRRFVLGMHSRALPMAAPLLPSLDMKGRTKLLDVASGPGTFSAMLAEKNPSLLVTMFDLPPVLAVTRELVSTRPCASRVSFHPGDYHSDALPGGFDAVLFCGALHQEDAHSALGVMEKVFESMEPGGKLFLVDMMLQADRTSPIFSSLFSINMMLTSPSGRVFSENDVRQILARSGFENTSCLRPAECPYWVMTAEKPLPVKRL